MRRIAADDARLSPDAGEGQPFIARLTRPLGLGVDSDEYGVPVVTKVLDEGSAVHWNKRMRLADRPGLCIRAGDLILQVTDDERLVGEGDGALSHADLMAHMSKRKEAKGTVVTMTLAHPKHLLTPKRKKSKSKRSARRPSPERHDVVSTFRVVNWRVQLGVVQGVADASVFVATIEQQRAEYQDLCAKHGLPLPGTASSSSSSGAGGEGGEQEQGDGTGSSTGGGGGGGPGGDNAGLLGSTHAEMMDTMQKDLKRTFSEFAFFNDMGTRCMLERVLCVWALEQGEGLEGHDNSPYRQGMHEVLAVVVMALYKDTHRYKGESAADDGLRLLVASDANSGLTPQQTATVLSEEHLEHDAYTLFSYLMHTLLPFYTGAAEVEGVTNSACQPFLFSKVKRIHHELLKSHDPALYAHLQQADVMPQLYLIRWLRVLFTREFTLKQALSVWDAIFETKGMELVDFVCVAMLCAIRPTLMAAPPAMCLMSVFHYPKLDDKQVSDLIELARSLHSNSANSSSSGGGGTPARSSSFSALWSGVGSRVRRSFNALVSSANTTPSKQQHQERLESKRRVSRTPAGKASQRLAQPRQPSSRQASSAGPARAAAAKDTREARRSAVLAGPEEEKVGSGDEDNNHKGVDTPQISPSSQQQQQQQQQPPPEQTPQVQLDQQGEAQ